jgi:hypothetical protein
MAKAIQAFIQEGDHIILLIDSYSNMKHSDIQGVLQDFSLKEVSWRDTGMMGWLHFGETMPEVPLMVFGQPLKI